MTISRFGFISLLIAQHLALDSVAQMLVEAGWRVVA